MKGENDSFFSVTLRYRPLLRVGRECLLSHDLERCPQDAFTRVKPLEHLFIRHDLELAPKDFKS
jgi:hypothetical protein